MKTNNSIAGYKFLANDGEDVVLKKAFQELLEDYTKIRDEFCELIIKHNNLKEENEILTNIIVNLVTNIND